MIDALTYVNLKKINRHEKVDSKELLKLQKSNYIDKNNHLLTKAKDEIKSFDKYISKDVKNSTKLSKISIWMTWIGILLCGIGIDFEWPNFNNSLFYIIIAIGVVLLLGQPIVLEKSDKKI